MCLGPAFLDLLKVGSFYAKYPGLVIVVEILKF